MASECEVDFATVVTTTGAAMEAVLEMVTATVGITIPAVLIISATMVPILVGFYHRFINVPSKNSTFLSDGPMNFNNFNNGNANDSYCNNEDGAFRIHMRGLPFVSDEVDIREFFSPLKPLEVEITYDDRRRHAGEANVFFTTIEEIDEAMKKHKEMMGSRWIELFFKGFVTGSNNYNEPTPVGSGFGRNNMRNNRF
jgi:RNA recognition motif-containing protein